MFKMVKKQNSQLRFDVINNDWVVVAPGRAKRPEDFIKKETDQAEQFFDERLCVFCNYFTHSQFANKSFAVVPNKFPAFSPSKKNGQAKTENNLFQTAPTCGFHEVVIFKDHSKQLFDFSVIDWQDLLDVYQQRYLALSKEKIVNYVSIFNNFGQAAGASQTHPHSQIIAIPFFDKDLAISLNMAKTFFKERGQCLFCAINRAEKVKQERIVFENSAFLAFCPFASKVNFEVAIASKKHLPYFEKITQEEKRDLAETFQAVLGKIGVLLGRPDYNFYLKTSPCDEKEYPFFHWRFVIAPRLNVWAGFELGTGIEIITVAPEKAAEFLRKTK